MSKKYTGHCACGAVTFAFDTDPTFIANCHCTDCKRASGGEMATFVAVPETDFTVFSGNTKSFSYGPNPVEPPEVGPAARPPTIRPRARVNGSGQSSRQPVLLGGKRIGIHAEGATRIPLLPEALQKR